MPSNDHLERVPEHAREQPFGANGPSDGVLGVAATADYAAAIGTERTALVVAGEDTLAEAAAKEVVLRSVAVPFQHGYLTTVSPGFITRTMRPAFFRRSAKGWNVSTVMIAGSPRWPQSTPVSMYGRNPHCLARIQNVRSSENSAYSKSSPHFHFFACSDVSMARSILVDVMQKPKPIPSTGPISGFSIGNSRAHEKLLPFSLNVPKSGQCGAPRWK